MKKLFKGLQYFSFFVPFRLLLPFFFMSAFITWYWLQQQIKNPESSFAALIALLLKLVLIFFSLLICFSFLTVLVSYVYFLFNRKSILSKAIIKMKQEENLAKNNTLQVSLNNIIPPFLGNIRFRLVDSDFTFSEKFKVRKKNIWQIFTLAHQGEHVLVLPAIKQYEIKKLLIYFEDFFQLFSFTGILNYITILTIQPENFEQEVKQINPRKTIESDIRVEQLKRTEGEYINYKDFENHDDVRRIVWKIYARNKELVVRTPEIFDPYASKITFYASFHKNFSEILNKHIHFQILNFYKTEIWNSYKNIADGKLAVEFVPDQMVNATHEEHKQAKVKLQIAMMDWQQNSLTDYCKKNDAAVLCISSFTDENDLQKILQVHNNQLQIIFIKLSEAYNKPFITDWLKWLFIQVEEDAVERNRTWFAMSGLKRKLLQQEKKLEHLLVKNNVEV